MVDLTVLYPGRSPLASQNAMVVRDVLGLVIRLVSDIRLSAHPRKADVVVIEAYDITLKIAVADKHACTDDCPEDESCWDERRPPTANEADTLFMALCDALGKRHNFTGSIRLADPSTAELYVLAEPVPWWSRAWTSLKWWPTWWLWYRWRQHRP